MSGQLSLLVVLCALLGLVIGSFLNVVIYRVPAGQSIVRPRSHCPACGAGIRPRDEIPVVSWLILRRRCRDCGAPISGRYATVELLTAGLFGALAVRFAQDAAAASWRVLPAFLYLAAVGIALAVIDLDTRRLPDALTLPSYVVAGGLLAGAVLAGAPLANGVRAVAGAAVMFAVYFALWFAYPKGMGFGDVKLAGLLGLYLGWLSWPTLAVGLFAGWFFGGATGLILLATRRVTRKTAVPFGPFMIVGAFTAIIFGEPLVRAWLP